MTKQRSGNANKSRIIVLVALFDCEEPTNQRGNHQKYLALPISVIVAIALLNREEAHVVHPTPASGAHCHLTKNSFYKLNVIIMTSSLSLLLYEVSELSSSLPRVFLHKQLTKPELPLHASFAGLPWERSRM